MAMRILMSFHEGMVSASMEENGFSVIEGMLAATILAVGLLALASMQGIALGRNVDANQLTIATNLGADMVERIQFNRRNASAYNNIDTFNGGTQPATDVMARGDYEQWQERLALSGLPNVRGRVAVNTMGPTTPTLNQSLLTVQVIWSGTINSETSAVRTRTLTLETVIAPQ